MSESNSHSGAPAAPPPSTGEASSGPAPLEQSPKLQGGLSAEEAVRRLTESRSGARPAQRREPRAESTPAAADASGDPIDNLITAFRSGEGAAEPPSRPPGANGHDPAPDTPIRLTIDGRAQDFSPEQLVNQIRMAADYTKKAQALADLNRQVAERAEAIDKMLPVLVPEIERQIAALDAQLGQVIDWDTLARTDPAEYVRQDALFKRAQAERAKLADLTAMQAQETEAANARRLAEGHAQLVKALPGWDNPQTRGRLQSEMIRWGRQNGYSDQQLESVYEPRDVTTLFKAMAFDRLMNGVKTDAPPVPTVQRRGTPPPPARERPLNDAERRFSESHSMRDAVAVLNQRRRVH